MQQQQGGFIVAMQEDNVTDLRETETVCAASHCTGKAGLTQKNTTKVGLTQKNTAKVGPTQKNTAKVGLTQQSNPQPNTQYPLLI